MSYIGNTQQNQNYVPAIDYFNGDGSTVAFTLSRPVASVAAVQAVISNVPQNPGSAFTVSGSTITFTSAPPSGTNNIYVYYTSPNTQVVQPGQGTVGATQIDGNYALWNKSGSDINYTAGNVLVGTATASQKNTIKQSVDSTYAGMGVGVQKSNDDSTLVMGYRSDISPAGFFIGPSYGSTGSYYPLSFRTSDTVRMTIDSSGRVTTPYQTMVIAAVSSGNITGDATVVWNSVSLNVGSAYNASNGVFTCPVAGNYLVYTQACSVATTTLGLAVRYNGTVWSRIQSTNNQGASSYQSYSMSSILHCAANDTIDIRVPALTSIYGNDTNYANMYITLLS